MELTTLLTIIGMILVNGAALIGFFMKMKLDIAAINIKILELENNQKRLEMNFDKTTDKLLEKLEVIDKITTDIRLNCVAHQEFLKKNR